MLNRLYHYHWIVLIVAVLSLVGGIAVWRAQQTPTALAVVANTLQKQLGDWEKDFLKTVENRELILKLAGGNQESKEAEALYDKFYSLLIYRNDTLVFWNNNEVLPPDSVLYHNTDQTRLLKLPNGYYQLCKKTLALQPINGTLQKVSIIALQLVKHVYYVQNKYLQNNTNALLEMPDELVFSTSPKPNKNGITNIDTDFGSTDTTNTATDSTLFDNANGQTQKPYFVTNASRTDFFYLQYDTSLLQKRVSYLAIGLQFLGIFALLVWLTIICLQISVQYKRPLEASILLIVLFLSVKALTVVFEIPNSLNLTELFNIQQYGRHALFMSPGELLINIIGVTWILCFLYRLLPSFYWYRQYPKNIKWHFTLYLLVVGLSFLLTYTIFYTLKIFIYYFNAKIDILNVVYANKLSLLALFSIGFMCVIYLLFLQKIAHIIKKLHLNKWQYIAGFGLILLLYLFVLYSFEFSWAHLFTLFWLIVFVGGSRYSSSALHKLSPFRLFSYVFFFSILFAVLIQHFTERCNFENIKRFAGKLAIQEDPVTEELLGEAALAIITNGDLTTYFVNNRTSNVPESLSRYIKRVYLNNQHFEQYEIDIAAFDDQNRLVDDASGQRTISEQEYEYKTVNKLRTNNNYIYLTRGEPGSYNYLAKLPIFDPDLKGFIYIEMRPKIDKSNVYPELTLEDQYRQANETSNYQYAIYNNGILESSVGNYSYPYLQDSTFISPIASATPDTVFTFFKEKQENGQMKRINRDTILVNYSTISVDHYKHLLYNLKPQKTVVVSQENQTIFGFLSSFLYIYTLVFISFMLVIVLMAFSAGSSSIALVKDLLYNSLRRRINMIIITVLLVSFVAIGAATISYFFNLSDQHNREQLIQKQNGILASIEATVRHDQAEQVFSNLKSENKSYFDAIAKELLEINKIDINIFDKYGQLVTSSQPRIFTEHLIAKQLHPLAYNAIARQHESQFVQNEQIGKLRYIASYMPLKDKDNKLFGFLNTPYFAREKEFRNEIARFLAQITNIYILLLIIGSVLAVFVSNTITKPLLMISEKLSGIQLGKKNELLTWPNNDEIGALVQQYNATVKELESNAKMLAQSERQNAWQSMARQVAHEIKNPLTPMKLGIEHLQRAYRDKHPNVQQMTEKILNRLIEQIDLLSQIATEFSNFAKMPKPNNEIINLKTIITNVIGLYNDAQEAHLHIKLPDRACFVYADKNQLIRVFTNLIKNAIQAIPNNQKGVIVVNVKLYEKLVIVAIADNGIGISPEMNEKVFTPNFTTKNSGMGLGLAMSQSIIEAAKGKIWFESEANVGTTFFVKLPLVQPKQEFIEN